jgi:hypothetical protein
MSQVVGTYLEVCSCEVICGCCILDTVEPGPPQRDIFERVMCNGVSLWDIGLNSSIGGVPVSGSQVACVSLHYGSKKTPRDVVVATYVDAPNAAARTALVGALTDPSGAFAVVANLISNSGGRSVVQPASSISITGGQTPALTIKVAGVFAVEARATFTPATVHAPPVLGLGAPSSVIDVGYSTSLNISAPVPSASGAYVIDILLGTKENTSALRCPFDLTWP